MPIFAAAPIILANDRLITSREFECIDEASAIAVAERLAEQPGHSGAWAHRLSGDPIEPAVVLKRFGGLNLNRGAQTHQFGGCTDPVEG